MNSSTNKVLEPVAQLEAHIDIAALSQRWLNQGIPHRVAEDAGWQIIYALPQHKNVIKSELTAFREGNLSVDQEIAYLQNHPQSSWVEMLKHIPVTFSMIFLSVLGFAATELELDTITDLLVIQTIDYSAAAAMLNLSRQISINEFLAHGHYWRLVTPIFLHFGWVHLVFNMLWTWELGRRIEHVMGSVHLLMIILFVGIASNLYQTFATPFAYFGGMSGVIYGLLGYCGVFTLLAPHKALHMPIAIYILMLGSLLIGYSGVFDFLAVMANTAHLMGLVFGVIIAIPAALLYRFVR